MQPIDTIQSYHAHIYFSPETRDAAAALRADITALFPAALMGRWHDRPVGPHPTSMYQVAFAAQDFARFVPWLSLNRGELAILVHPNTDDEYMDHAHHALWLGEILPLKFEVLKKRDAA